MYSPNVADHLVEMDTFKVSEDDNIALLQLSLSNLMLNCNNFYSGKSEKIGIVKIPYSYTYICDQTQYECSFPFTVLDVTRVINTPSRVVDSIEQNFPLYSDVPIKVLVNKLIEKVKKYNYVTVRERSLSMYLPQKETLEILSQNTKEKLQCIQKTNSKILNNYFLKLFDYFPLTPDVVSQRRIFYTDIRNTQTIDENQTPMPPDILYMIKDVASRPKSMNERIETIMKQYVLPSMKVFTTMLGSQFGGVGVRDDTILPITTYDCIFCNFYFGTLDLSKVSDYLYDDGVFFGVLVDEELLNNWITCFGNTDRFGNSLVVGPSNTVTLQFRYQQVTMQNLPIVSKDRFTALLQKSFKLEKWEQFSFPRTNEIADIFVSFAFRKTKSPIQPILLNIDGASMLTPAVEHVLTDVINYTSTKTDITGYIADVLKQSGDESSTVLLRDIIELSTNMIRDKKLDAITPSVVASVITGDEDLRQFSSEKILGITFPYKKYFILKGRTFRSMFAQFEAEPIVARRGSGGDELWVCERRYPEDTDRIDSITDMIVEPQRIICSENNKQSPLQAWKSFIKDYDNLSEEYWMKNPDKARIAREEIYNVSRGCNLFNVSFCKALYTKFGNKKSGIRILDCAAGWGDRLIAAAAIRARVYTGWDPNKSLQNVYNEIINLTEMNSYADVKILTRPMEDDADFIKTTLASSYDIVISSPPFFTQEHYEGEETSTRRYKTREEWDEKYFKVMLECGVAALVIDGYFILYLPPYLFTTATGYLSKMSVRYEGKAAFLQTGGSKSTKRYAYIWRKVGRKSATILQPTRTQVPDYIKDIIKTLGTTEEMAKRIHERFYDSSQVDTWLASASVRKSPIENFNLLRNYVCTALRSNIGFKYCVDDKSITFFFIEKYASRIAEKSQAAAKIISDILESKRYILSH